MTYLRIRNAGKHLIKWFGEKTYTNFHIANLASTELLHMLLCIILCGYDFKPFYRFQ